MLEKIGKQGNLEIMSFNAKKSLILVFNKTNGSCGIFKLNGKEIQIGNEIKYLINKHLIQQMKKRMLKKEE